MAEHGYGNGHEDGQHEDNRITLVQRQSGLQPRDPGKMAELQVTELDKFAKRLREKRSKVGDRLERDRKEVEHIDNQIAMIMNRYSPLLERLESRKKERERVKTNLDACLRMETEIMDATRARTKTQLSAGSHVSAKFASMELAAARGFSCARGTTYSRSSSSSTLASRAKANK